ncbi:MAG: hypothetical protein U9N85_08825, partial [Bacteroidota bacterium]|nr:hypothetical protein [Bacteroidota bacterium]
MIDSKYIKQYMLQNSFIGSMEKGENLYMSGAIKDIEQSDKDDIIKAKVQGSLLYTVRVVFLGTKIVSSCTCPYN